MWVFFIPKVFGVWIAAKVTVQAIGTALITPFTTLDTENPPSNAMLSLLAQVLDSFIDLYADETKPTEKVFSSKNFLDVLKPTLPKLQTLVGVIVQSPVDGAALI